MLSTFDYETSARATVPADVSDEGRALVSGRLLADICRSLPNKPVEMTIEGAKVSLTCGSARFSLQTMPVEEYPSLPDMPEATGTVRSDVFAAAVAQAVTAAGRDDMLPVLTGVRIEIEGADIALLATDRFRLSLRELTWEPGATDATAAALVPARVLADTAKSLTAGTEVTIALSTLGQPARASSASRVRPVAAYDAPPPACSTASSPRSARCSRASRPRSPGSTGPSLVESVKRVSLVAERNTAVQLAFSDGVLTLDAGTGDEALATEQIDAQVKGDRHHHRLQPAVPARRADRHRVAGRRDRLHPGVEARGHGRRRQPGRRGRPGVPLPADAAPPAVLTAAPTA